MSKQEDILKELKAKFDALCDEQEQLPRDGFAKVFEVLDSLEEDFTLQHPYTENEDNINKALELTGHSTDEAFCKAFKRNNQIIIEGKKIQRLGIKISLQQGKFIKPQQEPTPDEWIFLTPSIIISKELIPVLDQVWEKELCKDDGIFSSHSDIPKEDENDDDFLMIDAYGVQCNGLQVYYRDLQKYGVISGVLNKPIFKKALLVSLKEICTFIKENTDKPNKVRNHIRKKIKWFDTIPVHGLIFQILILQGLISWFENVSLEKGEKGYKDAEMLGQWIMNILLKKEVSFCYFLWGDGDKIWLKPLCNYLLSTQAGQAIQEQIRYRANNEETTGKPQPKQTLDTSLSENETFLPVTLRTERALKYFPKAIEESIITNTDIGYSMGTAIKTKAALAYFLELVFCRDNTGKDNGNDFPETDLNTLFGESRLGKARGQYASNKSGKPKGYEIIDKIFE
ncbi:hypothetical protein [Bacteroides sp.]|uniref:hypothetical protein n=1 Tax=Bacteroides sp. TaxID=29523 RepID=UPI0026042E41|nr:hypothetical protein [Bacteroides sp.]MDD3040205.1 hypothetical protein [Bacteroides sp.]